MIFFRFARLVFDLLAELFAFFKVAAAGRKKIFVLFVFHRDDSVSMLIRSLPTIGM